MLGVIQVGSLLFFQELGGLDEDLIVIGEELVVFIARLNLDLSCDSLQNGLVSLELLLDEKASSDGDGGAVVDVANGIVIAFVLMVEVVEQAPVFDHVQGELGVRHHIRAGGAVDLLREANAVSVVLILGCLLHIKSALAIEHVLVVAAIALSFVGRASQGG